ncbi:DivIVA domain-containing protein [Nesterenkonia sp. YGD6]|uniref:DivIVA domain-containing protein n=1 Tax=Nesterenkonia sp. YGD6 TaxID=2901231 RepID=UPI001F4CD575|nr:DivIVA domain-containing protein [Nesterenkonia sp. YGD6]MCH8562085.1 DivIVA domain-containing protein [Nesterenkonia sp. YGD6]
MLWLYLLAVVLLALVVAALLGRWDGASAPREETDLGESDVDDLLRRRAEKHITADDLQEVRLDSAVRGYRMDQVDRLLDALGQQLRELQGGQSHQAQSAAEAPSEPQESRYQVTVEPDTGPSDRARGVPDKDLRLPSQADPKPEFPRVE